MTLLTGGLVDPCLNSSFRLQVDGLPFADFAECTGLSAESPVEEYAEGGENRFSHKFPGRASYPNLVLTRGTGVGLDLWTWFEEWSRGGRIHPRDGQILLLSSVEGVLVPVRGWAFSRGWPAKAAGPDLNALAPGVALESVEIVHRGIAVIRGAM
jgi:phage tail-like protein